MKYKWPTDYVGADLRHRWNGEIKITPEDKYKKELDEIIYAGTEKLSREFDLKLALIEATTEMQLIKNECKDDPFRALIKSTGVAYKTAKALEEYKFRRDNCNTLQYRFAVKYAEL